MYRPGCADCTNSGIYVQVSYNSNEITHSFHQGHSFRQFIPTYNYIYIDKLNHIVVNFSQQLVTSPDVKCSHIIMSCACLISTVLKFLYYYVPKVEKKVKET